MTSEEKAELAQRIARLSHALDTDSLPPRTAKPRNLRQGIYRGGRAPYDLYRRFYAGINGTPMRAAYSMQAPMQRPARKSLTSPSRRWPP